VEGLERILAADVVWHATGRTLWRGDHVGRKAVLDFLARIGESMDVFDARLDDVLVSEDRVAVVFHVSGQRGPRTLEVDYHLMARVKDGRVKEVWTMPLDPDTLEAFFVRG
jgi:ketosteroid isomerase-like protein